MDLWVLNSSFSQLRQSSRVCFIKKSYSNWRGRVLHTNNFFIQKSYPKNSKDLLDLFNITLYTKTVMWLILPYFIDEKKNSRNWFTLFNNYTCATLYYSSHYTISCENAKKMFSTIKRHAKYPFTGQNTQQNS